MFREVLDRRDVVIERRMKRTDMALKLTGAAMAVLVVVVFLAGPGMTSVETSSVSGALLLSSPDGLLVLVAVAAFVLGVVVALLAVRSKAADRKLKSAADMNSQQTEQENSEIL